ncbi:hypothetical protein PMAYCL1PPCAC_27128, partial [Pristionchus mayeri]
IKLRIILGIFQACTTVLCRMVVIIHQYFAPSEYAEHVYLIVCSLNREAFLGYFSAIASILAMDRGLATVAWAWLVT